MRSRKINIGLLVIVLLSFMAVQTQVGARPGGQNAATQAASSIQGTVNVAALVLRASPSNIAPKLSVLNAGAVLTVIGRNSSGTWIQVIAPDNQAGWVGSAYVALKGGKLSDLPTAQGGAAEPCAPVATIQGRVNTTSLELRSDPVNTADRITTLKAGAQLSILGQNRATTWLFVQTADGLQGWAASPYIYLSRGKLADVPIIEPSQAGASATAVATASAAEATVAATMAATPCPTAEATATTAAATASAVSGVAGKVNTEGLALRNLPATTGEKLDVLKAGDTVTVVGQNKTGTWLQVLTKDGIIGWVGSAYVFLSGGKLSDVPIVE